MLATIKTHEEETYFNFVKYQLADEAWLYASILYS